MELTKGSFLSGRKHSLDASTEKGYSFPCSESYTEIFSRMVSALAHMIDTIGDGLLVNSHPGRCIESKTPGPGLDRINWIGTEEIAGLWGLEVWLLIDVLLKNNNSNKRNVA